MSYNLLHEQSNDHITYQKSRRVSAALLTPKERVALAESVRGAWKRPLKQSLGIAANIRKGLDRQRG